MKSYLIRTYKGRDLALPNNWSVEVVDANDNDEVLWCQSPFSEETVALNAGIHWCDRQTPVSELKYTPFDKDKMDQYLERRKNNG